MSIARYEIREASDGSFYFVLLSANNEIVMTSETYTRRADAERGIADANCVAIEAEGYRSGP